MLHLAGLLFGLVLAAVVAVSLVVVWRAPFRGLGVLVAGMAVHNLCIMLLLRAGVPGSFVRVIQLWKEGVLALLAILVLLRLWEAVRARTWPRLVLPDYIAAGFTIVLVFFLLLPVGGHLLQRVLDVRTLGLIPLLYLYGRVFWPGSREDRRWTFGLIVGAAGLVGAVGLVELWFLPTSTWLTLGVPAFNDWLGRPATGLGGLPANFFQTTANDILVRRMVSTYISPLGIAYTALVVIPILVAMWAAKLRRRSVEIAAWIAVVLVVASVVFSLTRFAMVLLVLEVGLLALLLLRIRVWGATAAVAAAIVFGLYGYFYIAPTNQRDLRPVREPAGYALVLGTEPHPMVVPAPTSRRSGAGSTRSGPSAAVTPNPTAAPGGVVYAGDPSLKEHLQTLRVDFRLFLRHPLGLGLGTFVPRFEAGGVTGESAVFWVIDETGVVGGALYVVLYALLLLAGWRAFRSAGEDWTSCALPLVALVGGLGLIPITLTSDLWGDLSVTFLLWWAAGHAVSGWRSAASSR